MTLLVVASPCALVLSIPSAILAAIAWGARRGVLFRGGAAVEQLAEIDIVAMDKTGTLTTGDLRVETVESFPPGREALVAQLAYSLDRHSTHPLARAITRYGKRKGLEPLEASDFESVAGMGLRGKVGGREVHLGRRTWAQPKVTTPAPRLLRQSASACPKSGFRPGRSAAGCCCAMTCGPKRDASSNNCASAVCKRVVLTGDRQKAAERCARNSASMTCAAN